MSQCSPRQTRPHERAGGDWLVRTERTNLEPSEVIVNRGTLDWGAQAIEYYTTQPAPAQWAAIAVVPLASGSEGTSRMLVGAGASEEAAVSTLIQRLARTALVLEPAHEPSNWFGG